jgi:hypothetical protein
MVLLGSMFCQLADTPSPCLLSLCTAGAVTASSTQQHAAGAAASLLLSRIGPLIGCANVLLINQASVVLKHLV